MKRLFTTSLAALLLVLAAAMPAAAADPPRPFHGSWVSPDGFDFAAPGCPAGAFLRFTTQGTGEFTHLGLASLTMTHCTFVSATSPSGWTDIGPLTLVAANGDTLVLAHSATFTLTPNPAGPPPFTSALSTLEWSVLSGTGRFAHATGSGTGWADDNMLTGIQEFHLSGSIRY